MSMTASAIASKNYYAGTAQKEFTSGGAELYIGYDYNYSQVYVGCIRFTLAKRASRVDISGIRTYGYNNTASNKPLYYAVSQTLNDPRYINKTDTDGALGSVYWTALEQGRDITLYDVPAGTNYLYLWALSGHHSRSRFWDVPESISYEPVLGSSIASISSPVETLGSLAISMDRADSAHVHRATFSCEGTELGQSELFGVSLSYAVPREWFSGYPNKAALSITVSIQTYEDAAGSTATGDAVTATFTLKADGGMKPAVGEGFAAAAPYNTGAVSGFSGYVKGYSKAQVSFDEAKVDMSATAGASIAGYSITAMGSTDNEEPYLTPILTGSTGIVCTVTDSRGRSASVTLQITVLDYSAPAVTSLQAVRCASDGAEDEGGSYIAVTASALYSELEGENELQLSARISAADGSFDDSYSIESGTAAVLGGTLSPDKSYTITVTATDKLGNSGQSQIKLVTRKWALKFNAKGTAAAFGGAPEHDKMLELKDGWGLSVGGEVSAGALSVSGAAALGSLTVGGKSLQELLPAGYAPNFLDNSDFTNPVNQRGLTSYSGTAYAYTIDRWRINLAAAVVSPGAGGLTVNNSAGTGMATLYQQLESLADGEYTFACETEGGISLHSCTKSGSTVTSVRKTLAGVADVSLNINSSTGIYVRVGVAAGASATIRWAALYRGEYTADSLPEYQPKGYGAELRECRRYYLPILTSSASNAYPVGNGHANSTTSIRILVPAAAMRVNPSIKYGSGEGLANIALIGGGVSLTPTAVSLRQTGAGIGLVFTVSGAKASYAYAFKYNGSGMAFSADL